mmetsp:Transcript_26264/g.105102  ORF Transcript_26264/g.105102 Transcript_26264/m.105102 type:complete len:146 (+) Transcript_26264:2210-2647(+)
MSLLSLLFRRVSSHRVEHRRGRVVGAQAHERGGVGMGHRVAACAACGGLARAAPGGQGGVRHGGAHSSEDHSGGGGGRVSGRLDTQRASVRADQEYVCDDGGLAWLHERASERSDRAVPCGRRRATQPRLFDRDDDDDDERCVAL